MCAGGTSATDACTAGGKAGTTLTTRVGMDTSASVVAAASAVAVAAVAASAVAAVVVVAVVAVGVGVRAAQHTFSVAPPVWLPNSQPRTTPTPS